MNNDIQVKKSNTSSTFVSAEVELIPQNTVDVNVELEEKINRLLDMLEDNDDVQDVYHNGNFQ